MCDKVRCQHDLMFDFEASSCVNKSQTKLSPISLLIPKAFIVYLYHHTAVKRVMNAIDSKRYTITGQAPQLQRQVDVA
jgi:hypothetical protein